MSIALRFYGRLSHISGYAAASRASVRALHSAGLDVAATNLDPTVLLDKFYHCLQNHDNQPQFHIVNWFWFPLAIANSDSRNSFLREHIAAEDTRRAIGAMLERFTAVVPLSELLSKLIVIVDWETDRLPANLVAALNRVREVWVPCDHNFRIFEQHLSVPVFKWPHAFVPPEEARDPSGLVGLRKTDFVFYSIFVWQDRKCPLLLIEAFLRAFPDNPNAVLFLKIIGNRRSAEFAVLQIRKMIGSLARVIIVNEIWSEAQISSLFDRGNCYVSLHRGEGWAYPLFGAACRGTPVVCTAYSGPVDYLDPGCHRLVRFSLVPVAQRGPWYSSDMYWAQPDLEDAIRALQDVYSGYDRAVAVAGEWAERIRHRFSYQAVGQSALQRLGRLVG